MAQYKYDMSIIIPVYNAAKYLPRFLKSILNQGIDVYKNVELIFVDDGSSDNSEEIIHKYCDKRVNYLVLRQSNQRQAAARNNGIKHANGKYLYFCDADDVLLPGVVANMLNTIHRKNVELYVFSVQIKYPTKMILDQCYAFKYPAEIIENFLTKNTEADVGLWNKCFSHEIVTQNNIEFENKNFFEDSLFILRYLLSIDRTQIVYSSFEGYLLYKNEGSTTRAYRPEIDSLAKEYVQKVVHSLSLEMSSDVSIGFKNRIFLHVLHHHIKFDPKWTAKKNRKFCRNNLSLKSFGGRLGYKYRISVLLASIFPMMYFFLYANWKK